jgi:hypothetical protein
MPKVYQAKNAKDLLDQKPNIIFLGVFSTIIKETSYLQ